MYACKVAGEGASHCARGGRALLQLNGSSLVWKQDGFAFFALHYLERDSTLSFRIKLYCAHHDLERRSCDDGSLVGFGKRAAHHGGVGQEQDAVVCEAGHLTGFRPKTRTILLLKARDLGVLRISQLQLRPVEDDSVRVFTKRA